MIRTFLSNLLLLVFILAGVGGGWGLIDFFRFMDQQVTTQSTMTVGKGWSLSKVSHVLEKKGIISSSRWFVLLARYHKGGYVRAGEYAFYPGETPPSILMRLRNGEVMVHRISLPEGITVAEVSARMEQQWPEISQLMADPLLPKQLGVDSPSLEGWLFPETYHYQQSDSALDMLTRMVKQSRKIMDELWEKRDKTHTLNKFETLILASIIEKETGQKGERAHISAVFHNRLKRKMRLQTDPTVIYGIKNFDGNITRKHLRTPTPFNTYTQFGLPPTPICNPGRAAIHAAIHPNNSKDIFFVARGDGSHAFSQTLKEHEAFVDRYQRKRKSRKKVLQKGSNRAQP